jgi:Flp pilus assembly protein TadG
VSSSPVPRRRARRAERGASAVEFALIVPVVILLLMGTVSTGLSYNDHVSLTNAAREGARYGAAADITSSSWATSVQTRVQEVYFNAAGTAPTDNQVCVQLVKADGTVYASDSGTECGTAPGMPTNMTTGSCAVRVWMSKPRTVELVVVPDIHVTLKAESIAVYGRTSGTTCTAK